MLTKPSALTQDSAEWLFVIERLKQNLRNEAGASTAQFAHSPESSLDKIIEVAKNHRVLMHLDLPRHPKLIQEILRHQKRSLKKAALLFKLSALFDQHEIPHLCLKGHALSLRLFQNAHRRMFSDIDLVVSMSNLKRACLLLLQNGFTLFTPIELNEHFEDAIRFEKDIVFWSPDRSTRIEIHFKLAHEMKPISWTSLWQSRETLPFDGRTLYTLSDEMNLLYLCAHGHHHGWERMDWLFDFAHLLAENFDDARRAIPLFKSHGLENEFKIALQLLQSLFQIQTGEKPRSTYWMDQVRSLQALRTQNQLASVPQKMRFWKSPSLKKNIHLLIQFKNRKYKPWILKNRPFHSYHLWLAAETAKRFLKVSSETKTEGRK